MAEPRRRRRGFGRIRQERSGRYSAAYIGPDHKLHKAAKTFASDIAAEGWLAVERRKIDLGTWGAVERSDAITLRAYANQWMEQRQLRPRTAQHYRSMLDRLILPDLGDATIVTLTPAKVRQWHAGLVGDHPTRNAHAYALLHAICATAVQDEVLDANPCRIRAAMQTKRRREIEILTPAEVDKLAAKMPVPLRASVILAAWCGFGGGNLRASPQGRQRRLRRAARAAGGHLPQRTVLPRPTQDRGRCARCCDPPAYPADAQGALEESRRTRRRSPAVPRR